MMRVLCADDDDDIRFVISIALRLDPTIEADIVHSGAEVLRLARERPYHVILLDAWMPDLDGYAVCRQLKQDPATAAVPVVFLTANAQRDKLQRAINCGAAAVITKPFDPMTLVRQIHDAVGQ